MGGDGEALQVIELNGVTVGGDEGAAEGVAEFAEVAGPGVIAEEGEDLLRGGRDDGEVREHGGEVFQALAEGWDAEFNGGNAGEELLAHAAGGDDAAEMGVIGDDEAGFAAETGVQPVQAEEELVLMGGAQGAEVIEEEGAEADLVDDAGGELFRGAAEEGAGGDGAELVEFAGDVSFAAAGLADKERGAEVGGNAADLHAQALGKGALPGKHDSFQL